MSAWNRLKSPGAQSTPGYVNDPQTSQASRRVMDIITVGTVPRGRGKKRIYHPPKYMAPAMWAITSIKNIATMGVWIICQILKVSSAEAKS